MILKRIFSLKVANELIKLGFEVIDYEINLSNPKLKIFKFEKTDKLLCALEEINKK